MSVKIGPIVMACRTCTTPPGEPCQWSSGPRDPGVDFHAARVRDAATASELIADPSAADIAVDDLDDEPPEILPVRWHDDGSPCACEPDCSCHPPARREPFALANARGSFHLEACPAFARIKTVRP